jgi:DNA-binding PadR family transcriptional regulator
MSRNTLGGFEHQVMLAVLRLGDEAYSVPIALEIEEHTGREVSQAAAFVTLRRLEKKGLLSSRLDDASVAETGRERRYFSVTPAGRDRLRDSRRTLLSLWGGVAAELDA